MISLEPQIADSVQATMYYPVAHGEAVRLQEMLEDAADERSQPDE